MTQHRILTDFILFAREARRHFRAMPSILRATAIAAVVAMGAATILGTSYFIVWALVAAAVVASDRCRVRRGRLPRVTVERRAGGSQGGVRQAL